MDTPIKQRPPEVRLSEDEESPIYDVICTEFPESRGSTGRDSPERIPDVKGFPNGRVHPKGPLRLELQGIQDVSMVMWNFTGLSAGPLPSNSVITPSNSVITPNNSVITPSNSVITPRNSVIMPSNSVIMPSNSDVISGNGYSDPENVFLSNGEISPGNDDAISSTCDVDPRHCTRDPKHRNCDVSPSYDGAKNNVSPSNDVPPPKTNVGRNDNAGSFHSNHISLIHGTGSLKTVQSKDAALDNNNNNNNNGSSAVSGIYLYNKTSWEERARISIYDVTGNHLKVVRQIPQTLCEHEASVYILPVTVQRHPLLAVSCYLCRVIRLYDVTTGHVTVAFKGPTFTPGRMCHGQKGEILTVYPLEPVDGVTPVFVLDATDATFKLKRTITLSYDGKFYAFSYHLVSDNVIITEPYPRVVNAYSGSTCGATWSRRVAANGDAPCGIVYSPEHDVMFIASYSCIVGLDPVDGSVVMVTGGVRRGQRFVDVCLCGDVLVALLMETKTSEFKLYLYAIAT